MILYIARPTSRSTPEGCVERAAAAGQDGQQEAAQDCQHVGGGAALAVRRHQVVWQSSRSTWTSEEENNNRKKNQTYQPMTEGEYGGCPALSVSETGGTLQGGGQTDSLQGLQVILQLLLQLSRTC